MQDIVLENVPDELYQHLKRRAEARQASLRDEIIDCLRGAVDDDAAPAEETLRRARELRKGVQGSLTEADLAALKAQGRP